MDLIALHDLEISLQPVEVPLDDAEFPFSIDDLIIDREEGSEYLAVALHQSGTFVDAEVVVVVVRVMSLQVLALELRIFRMLVLSIQCQHSPSAALITAKQVSGVPLYARISSTHRCRHHPRVTSRYCVCNLPSLIRRNPD